METHVKTVAILNIVLGALGVLAGLGMLLLFGGIANLVQATAHGDPDARIAIPILGVIGVGLFIFLLIVSIPGIVAGIGLLQFREWARILTIVISALNLINVPFGTALGAYGLWVLLSDATQPLFRARRLA